MDIPKICPKCQGDMQKGNFTGTPTEWHTTTEKNFLQTNGRTIDSFACDKCGYLESYVRK